MKKTTFTLLLSLACCWLAAQCPTGDITFSTQGQIDSFPGNYPGCTEIPGSVFINDSSIVRLDSLFVLKKIGGRLQVEHTNLSDLTGLDNLDSVKGCLRILENPVLVELTGLKNLKYVGFTQTNPGPNVQIYGFEIFGNSFLTSLDGLGNLNSMAGCLRIASNPSLTSIDELEGLMSVGVCIDNSSSATDIYSIQIQDNLKLSTLNGLDSLAAIESGVSIASNPALKSLKGLGNVHFIGGGLGVVYNDSLTTLNGLDNLDSLGGCLVIAGNPKLETLASLNRLRSIGKCWGHGASVGNQLIIYDNSQLTSLAGLDSIQFSNDVGYIIEIYGCPLLTTCEVHSICQYLQIGGMAEVNNNAPGCNSVAEVEAACIVSIEETSTGEPVVIFSPNPASDFLQIQINDPEKWEVSLFDLQGRQMFRQVVSGSQIIEVKDWPSGIYTLRAVSGERVFSGKIVKQ